MTTQTEDRAVWNCDNLVYTWHNEFSSPQNCELHLSKCDPCGEEFCYWCSIGGQCFALKSQERDSCIATVQRALECSGMAQNTDWYADRCYVIWQPKDHSVKSWERWKKKWSKRTALKPA